MGGDDQWSNILNGADLIRRKERKPAYALTTTLLVNSDGKKMGKTERGALWLDKNKCSVFDFYQYWRNIDDQEVRNCLCLLTFLPMDEINALCSEGANINEAKKVLAYTLTAQVHGDDEAMKAKSAAEALFSGGGDLEHMPTRELTDSEIKESGLLLPDLLVLCGLAKSKSEARRLIKDGGVLVGDVKAASFDDKLTTEQIEGEGVIIRKGKKSFCRVRRA